MAAKENLHNWDVFLLQKSYSTALKTIVHFKSTMQSLIANPVSPTITALGIVPDESSKAVLGQIKKFETPSVRKLPSNTMQDK